MVDMLCTAPILVHPDPDKPYVVTTDASGFAVGACLSQDHGEGLQPIAYMSKKMLPAETRYPIHEKELLAIICALKEWRHYLHGSKFIVEVITDHKSLVHLDTQPKLSERQTRWNEFLAEFQPFKIIYQEGKSNVVADALSRRPDHLIKDNSVVELNAVSSMNTTLKEEIINGYATDEWCRSIIAALAVGPSKHYSMKDRALCYDKKRIVVPDMLSLRTKILSEHHDGMLSGHLGLDKTYQRLIRCYYSQLPLSLAAHNRTKLACGIDSTHQALPHTRPHHTAPHAYILETTHRIHDHRCFVHHFSLTFFSILPVCG